MAASDEKAQLVSLLNKFDPGFLPQEVFLAISRLVVTPTIVLIPVRNLETLPEVLLIERDERDQVYQGFWHTPGSVLLATDASISFTLQRIAETELGISSLPTEPVFIGQVFVDIPRGKEISLLYKIEGNLDSKMGTWFKTNNLPENVVPTDLERIEAAISK